MSLVVLPDAGAVADTVAGELIAAIESVQHERGRADIVLTGGGLGIGVLSRVGEMVADAAPGLRLDLLHLWWGDERFLPSGDADRNETQAREALLDRWAPPASQVHPMPALDGPDGDDVDAAAARYADELRAGTVAGVDGLPVLDVVLLGMGPDGHVASLFPGKSSLTAAGLTVAEHESPKPPPQRVSLTFGAIAAAAEVWLVVAGADKAAAVAAALTGGDVRSTPAAGAVGRRRTRWFVDEAAAAMLDDTLLDDTRPDDTRLDDTRFDDTRFDDTRVDETRLDDTRLRG